MFKVGDRVVRINGPMFTIKRGQICTISELTRTVTGDLRLHLVGHGSSMFNPAFFSLVERQKTGYGKFISKIEGLTNQKNPV